MVKMGEIHVDGRPRKDYKYSVGFMDVISIPKMKNNYRVTITSQGLEIIDCPDKESKTKLVRITDKTLIEGGKVQLNLHDGRNIIVPVKNPKKPKEDVYSSGDSLFIEIPSQKIVDHLKFEKGNLALIIDGQNRGMFIKIKEIIKTRSREPNKVLCQNDDREFEAIKDYVFVVGKKKSLIKLEGN
jgi:small subunit ribosomal protein S4e